MASEPESRELRVTYTQRGLVVGWRCSACGRTFFVHPELATDVLSPPSNIAKEFDEHACSEAAAKMAG
jgi:hypothetical protein